MPQDPELFCRWTVAIVFLAAAVIGIPHRRRADRAGGVVSRRVDPGWFWAVMSVIAPVLALTCIAFLISPRWVEFAQLPLPDWLRLAGAPIALVGLLLFGWMFRHLGLNVTPTSMPRTHATLVTGGPYRWIRHPMYTAALVLVLGVSLLTASLIVMAGGVGMFALLAARSRVEEKRLIEKFGEGYAAYQHRTGRFFPRIP